MDFISIKEGSSSESTQFSENYKKIKNSSKSELIHSIKSKDKFKRRNGGIIYIGRIPHGFYEDEMRSYFNQFGKVTASVVARSKKSGRSRGFGFVQFADEDVAKIAAESMNNYLMFNRIIKCRYIPPEERKYGVYESSITPYSYPRQRNRLLTLKKTNKSVSEMTPSFHHRKVVKKLNKFKKFFDENGIDFTFKINDNGLNNAENGSKAPVNVKQNESGNELETDSMNGVLEIDESDNDIIFKTPPKVKKVIKKSLTSCALPEKTSSSPMSEKGKKTKTKSRIQEKSTKKILKPKKNSSKCLGGKKVKKSATNKSISVTKVQQENVKRNKNIRGSKKGN